MVYAVDVPKKAAAQPKDRQEADVTPLRERQESDGAAGDAALWSLDDLALGDKLYVRRTQPSYADGFCDHLIVAEGGFDDVLDRIKAQYGGGTYCIQKKRRGAKGGLVFAGRSATLTIAGEPLYEGRPYVIGPDGRRVPDRVRTAEPQTYAPASQPVVVSAPQGDGQMQQALLGLLGQLAKPGQSADLAGLAKVILPLTQQKERDSMADMERMLTLFTQMQRVAKTVAPEVAPEPPAAESASPWDGFAQMMMAKVMPGMLGGFGGAAAQPNPPAPVMPPPPSPHHLWHPTQGWVLPPRAQPQAAPPQAAPQAAPPQAPPPAPPHVADEEDDEYTPTPEGVLEDISALSAEEQNQLLQMIMGSTDASPVDVAAAFQTVASPAPTPATPTTTGPGSTDAA